LYEKDLHFWGRDGGRLWVDSIRRGGTTVDTVVRTIAAFFGTALFGAVPEFLRAEPELFNERAVQCPGPGPFFFGSEIS
jgi:hypothetical protein